MKRLRNNYYVMKNLHNAELLFIGRSTGFTLESTTTMDKTNNAKLNLWEEGPDLPLPVIKFRMMNLSFCDVLHNFQQTFKNFQEARFSPSSSSTPENDKVYFSVFRCFNF